MLPELFCHGDYGAAVILIVAAFAVTVTVAVVIVVVASWSPWLSPLPSHRYRCRYHARCRDHPLFLGYLCVTGAIIILFFSVIG